MDEFTRTRLRPVLPGIILSLAALLFGFGLGAAFGAAEGAIKGNLDARAQAVFRSVYEGDTDALQAVVNKSWTYLKRAHLHANGLGASALAAGVLLALLGPSGPLPRGSALCFGAGAVIYPVYWLSAGLLAPSLGSTGAAKEALSWLAIPGSGLCVLGLLGTVVVAVQPLRSASPTD